MALHTHTHTHTQIHIHTYTHARTQVRMHARMHARTHARTHAHTHIHTYMHTCIHTYMHTYIHTCIQINSSSLNPLILYQCKRLKRCWKDKLHAVLYKNRELTIGSTKAVHTIAQWWQADRKDHFKPSCVVLPFRDAECVRGNWNQLS